MSAIAVAIPSAGYFALWPNFRFLAHDANAMHSAVHSCRAVSVRHTGVAYTVLYCNGLTQAYHRPTLSRLSSNFLHVLAPSIYSYTCILAINSRPFSAMMNFIFLSMYLNMPMSAICTRRLFFEYTIFYYFLPRDTIHSAVMLSRSTVKLMSELTFCRGNLGKDDEWGKTTNAL